MERDRTTRIIGVATGFAGAIMGGTISAWFVGFSGLKSLICSLIIGLFSGALPALFAVGMEAIPVGAIFGALGYLWGQFLDVNLHFERYTVGWLMRTQPGLSVEAAKGIAQVQRQGATPWMLFRERMGSGEIGWIAVTVLVAALAAFTMMSLTRRDRDARQV
jgi:xanthosine utilization system XapX-like protein